MSARIPAAAPLMTPAQVAQLFAVDAKTVTRWAKAGKLTSIKTLGSHRRYFRAEVSALLRGEPLTREQVDALKANIGGLAIGLKGAQS